MACVLRGGTKRGNNFGIVRIVNDVGAGGGGVAGKKWRGSKTFSYQNPPFQQVLTTAPLLHTIYDCVCEDNHEIIQFLQPTKVLYILRHF
jgi:hypothetical protein